MNRSHRSAPIAALCTLGVVVTIAGCSASDLASVATTPNTPLLSSRPAQAFDRISYSLWATGVTPMRLPTATSSNALPEASEQLAAESQRGQFQAMGVRYTREKVNARTMLMRSAVPGKRYEHGRIEKTNGRNKIRVEFLADAKTGVVDAVLFFQNDSLRAATRYFGEAASSRTPRASATYLMDTTGTVVGVAERPAVAASAPTAVPSVLGTSGVGVSRTPAPALPDDTSVRLSTEEEEIEAACLLEAGDLALAALAVPTMAAALSFAMGECAANPLSWPLCRVALPVAWSAYLGAIANFDLRLLEWRNCLARERERRNPRPPPPIGGGGGSQEDTFDGEQWCRWTVYYIDGHEIGRTLMYCWNQ
jgi:hypothetical protein